MNSVKRYMMVNEPTEPKRDHVFVVERVVAHRLQNGKKFYQVKWRGFGTTENTWEPAESFFDRTPVDIYEKRRAAARSRRQREMTVKFNNNNAPRADAAAEPKPNPSKVRKSAKTSKSKKKKRTRTVGDRPESPSETRLSSGRVRKPTIKLLEQGAATEAVEEQQPEPTAAQADMPVTRSRRSALQEQTQPAASSTPDLEELPGPSSQPARYTTRQQVKESLKPEVEADMLQKKVDFMHKQAALDDLRVSTNPRACYQTRPEQDQPKSQMSLADRIVNDELVKRENDRKERRKRQAQQRQKEEEQMRQRDDACMQLLHHHELQLIRQLQGIMSTMDSAFTRPSTSFLYLKSELECTEVLLILERPEGMAAALEYRHKLSQTTTIDCVPLEIALAKHPAQVRVYLANNVEQAKVAELRANPPAHQKGGKEKERASRLEVEEKKADECPKEPNGVDKGLVRPPPPKRRVIIMRCPPKPHIAVPRSLDRLHNPERLARPNAPQLSQDARRINKPDHVQPQGRKPAPSSVTRSATNPEEHGERGQEDGRDLNEESHDQQRENQHPNPQNKSDNTAIQLVTPVGTD